METKTPSLNPLFDSRWDRLREALETMEQVLASGWYPARRDLLDRLSGALPPSGLTVWVPEADLETGLREVTVSVALPGVEKSEVRVEVGEDVVTVSGRRREGETGAGRRELPCGDFRRRVRLPVEVKPASAKATLRNGLLRVTVERARGRRAQRQDRVGGGPMDGLQAVGRTYRHFNRAREVAAILAKHGFGDLLHMLRVDRYLEAGARGLRHPRAFDAAERPARVRLALEELGPTFIKTGQYLSTRSDLLPPEYLKELAKLQDRVPPFPGDEARRIVEEELGAPLAQRFRSFTERPLAAASIAQVHEAETVDGEAVVVKVERPRLRETVAADLEIMAHLAALAERHLEDWRWRRPTRIVAEIARSLDREMDLSLEAAHAERFAREFAGDASVRVPRVRRDLSGPRVLTLERVEGIKPDDPAALERAGLDPRIVAERLGRQYLTMIFAHGFFHADPHPGNLLVQPGHAIAYLDFGMTGRLDRSVRERLAEILLAAVDRDEAALARALLAVADYDAEPDLRAFQEDAAELMDQYAYRPLGEWHVGRMFEQFFQTSARHRLRVPADLFLMVKALTELESLARALDPGFDAVGAAAPFIRRVRGAALSPRRLAETAARAGREALGLLSSAPADLREILRQARRGRLLIEFEHKGLEPALAVLDKVSNRLALAVLLGSLLIASSVIIHAGVPPYWHGVAALGLAGYLLAGMMSLWLLAAIVRHGRL